MKVSIIIPVYNVAPYIEECLQSVANQTYKNIEVLIVDDCGTDNSIKIAEDFVRRQNEKASEISYTILYHEKNKGVSVARNTGILAAKGDYLYFLDPDDFIDVACVEKLLKWVIEDPSVQMVASGLQTYENGQFLHRYDYHYKGRFIFNLEDGLKEKGLYAYACNKLVSRNALISNNLLFKEGIRHEDVLWTFETSYILKNIVVDDSITYYYRQTPTSFSYASSQQVLRQNRSMVHLYELAFLLKHSERRNKFAFDYLSKFFYLYFFEPLWHGTPEYSFQFYHEYRRAKYWNLWDLLLMRVGLFHMLLVLNRYLPEKIGFKYFRKLHMIFHKA